MTYPNTNTNTKGTAFTNKPLMGNGFARCWFILIYCIVLLTYSPNLTAQQIILHRIVLEHNQTQTNITFDSMPPSHHTALLQPPSRLVIDLHGVQAFEQVHLAKHDPGHIFRRAGIGQYQDYTRIVFDLDPSASFDINQVHLHFAEEVTSNTTALVTTPDHHDEANHQPAPETTHTHTTANSTPTNQPEETTASQHENASITDTSEQQHIAPQPFQLKKTKPIQLIH
tara:strand:- start:464 stop:1144 length:681 start_codon:yes stop_codon:yes gene_type:complete